MLPLLVEVGKCMKIPPGWRPWAGLEGSEELPAWTLASALPQPGRPALSLAHTGLSPSPQGWQSNNMLQKLCLCQARPEWRIPDQEGGHGVWLKLVVAAVGSGLAPEADSTMGTSWLDVLGQITYLSEPLYSQAQKKHDS